MIEQLNRSLSSRYRIDREIGAGGMATVYAAEDIRHGRTVAIKVLEPDIGAALGIDRFLTEIRVTAGLQHPNLVPLFDSGEADGRLYYVMPLVDGESLRARLERERQLPVDDTVRIGSAIASALEYAHGHGVIHRDLKPENILLQGRDPLVADFGIALAVSRAGGARITQTGLSLGTPQYMSPEQATGEKNIDARTDIYSLAAVLYEMLTGVPPHTGPTVQAIIARVVTDRPEDVRVLRPSVPAHVAFAIAKALEKVPADRWETAREFNDALNGRLHTDAQRSPYRTPKPARRTLALAALALLATGAAFAGWWRAFHPEQTVMAFALGLPAGVGMGDGWDNPIAISPDGRTIAFAGRSSSTQQLYLKRIDDAQPRPLPGTEGAKSPVFSPDGGSLAFIVRGRLRRMPAGGGASMEIQAGSLVADRAWPPVSLSWTKGDQIIAMPNSSSGLPSVIHAVPAIGGTPAAMTRLDTAAKEFEQRWPVALADGETVLYTSFLKGNDFSKARIGVASLATGRAVRLDVPGVRALGVVDDHIVFLTKEGNVRAVRVDLRKARVEGSPITLVEGVKTAYGPNAIALSPQGTLVYLQGNTTEQQLVLVDRTGAKRPVGVLRDYDAVRASPDGRRIAVDIDSDTSRDIWLYDLDQGTLVPLRGKTSRTYPAWSGDGRWLYYTAELGDTVFRRPADGSGTESVVAVQPHYGYAVSAGGTLLISGMSRTSRRPAQVRQVEGDDTAFRTLPGSTGEEYALRFSPDGRWLAMTSNASGVPQVYLRPVATAGPQIQVSTSLGFEAVWSPDGREVIYRDRENFIAAELDLSRGPVVKRRTTLFRDEFETYGDPAAYDVLRDGRFVVISHGNERDQVVVIVNWREQARARLRR